MPKAVDPVIGDGEFFTTLTDLSYPGFGINFEFKRSYRSRSRFLGPLGYGWDHSYNRRLFGDAIGRAYCDGSIDYSDGKLGNVHFTPLDTGLIRLVSGLVVSALQRLGSGLPFQLAVLPPTITDPGPGTPVPAGVRKGPIDYAASDGSSMRLTYDSSQPNPWALHELSGVVAYFDTNGYLAVMQHPAGPRMTFTWASGHLTQIVDTTGRTIILNYDASGKYLACLSRDVTCTQPIVSYGINLDQDLAGVSFGDNSTIEGSVQYVYHRGEPSRWWVGHEAAETACTNLCTARTTSPAQCRNQDVCHLPFTARRFTTSSTMLEATAPPAPRRITSTTSSATDREASRVWRNGQIQRHRLSSRTGSATADSAVLRAGEMSCRLLHGHGDVDPFLGRDQVVEIVEA